MQGSQRKVALLIQLVGAAALSVLASGTVDAQVPPGCSANRLNVDIQVSPPIVQNGGTATYRVDVINNPTNLGDACEVRDVFVTFCCPGPDGLPETGPDGCTMIQVQSQPCNVNNGATCVPTVQALAGYDLAVVGGVPAQGFSQQGLICRIGVNTGVTMARAQAMVDAGYNLMQTAQGVPQPALPKLLELLVEPPPPLELPRGVPSLSGLGLSGLAFALACAGWFHVTRRRFRQ